MEREEQDQVEQQPEADEAAVAAEAPEAAEPEPVEEGPAEPEATADEPSEPEATSDESTEPEATSAEPADSGAGETTDEGADEPTADTEETPAPAPEKRTLAELAADARYFATGKRKSSVARVIIRPGSGQFDLNGRPLDDYFPRRTHQAVVRQPLELTGYGDRVDVRARVHGGGISGQAGAVRHGIAKALIEADPALRPELKRRQLLTRDPREKERRKAGLKKARKRPQFSKR